MLFLKAIPSKTTAVILIQRRTLHIKKSELYKKCFDVLGVPDTSDQNTVRKAYIELVKKVHPDSGFPEASPERFQEIDNAFKILQEKFAKNRRGIYDEDAEHKIFDIRHTAPQHRQYLNFEGIGIGTPFQREKQYQQVKAMKAQERVLTHRIEKSQAGEKELMQKGTWYKTHAIKTKYGFDRVVEDLIQEAMSKGDFNNLSGAGKPLSQAQQQNPYLDFTTHKLNKILLDNGFTPEWISLQREIREAVQSLKKNLEEERSYFGDYPLNDDELIKWKIITDNYETDADNINKKIDKYNLIVPLLDNQMFRIKFDKIVDEILMNPKILRKPPQEPNKQEEYRDNNLNKRSSNDFFSFLGSLF